MRQILILFASAFLLIGCETTKEQPSYLISGNAEGVYNGIRVYLNDVDQRGRLTPSDTAIVMNETFTFEGSLENPKIQFITVNSMTGRVPLMLENSNIAINVDKSGLQNTTITGSKSHDLYMEFLNTFRERQRNFMEQSRAVNNAVNSGDSTSIALEQAKLEEYRASFVEYPYAFMESHNKDFVSLEVYEMQSRSREKDDQRLIDIFYAFDPTLRQSPKGILLNAQTRKLKQELEANKNLQIGMKAPLFSGPNPDGKRIALNEVTAKGKVTIVDFWAAWCGPCRRENPNVVRIYNEYHDKGLEIIGVSLDGQPRQKNAKEAWINAIAQDKLTWHQISNLQYFNGPIASLYNIQAIPATYILDSEGKIAAKNLRGAALELKVKELLGLN